MSGNRGYQELPRIFSVLRVDSKQHRAASPPCCRRARFDPYCPRTSNDPDDAGTRESYVLDTNTHELLPQLAIHTRRHTLRVLSFSILVPPLVETGLTSLLGC